MDAHFKEREPFIRADDDLLNRISPERSSVLQGRFSAPASADLVDPLKRLPRGAHSLHAYDGSKGQGILVVIKGVNYELLPLMVNTRSSPCSVSHSRPLPSTLSLHSIVRPTPLCARCVYQCGFQSTRWARARVAMQSLVPPRLTGC